MNFKLVLRVTGATLLVGAISLLFPLAVCLLYHEDPRPFLFTLAIIVPLGFAFRYLPKSDNSFFAREGFFTVALIWLLFGVFGALPFWFSGQFGSFVDCLFESISGFTTTGASILSAVEHLPKGLLFWRSFTHWLGGMGVLILTTALLPSLGISSTFLIRAESPGPITSKLVPKASQSSKILYTIYLVLTLAELFTLRIVGMPWYDAINHAMSTAGTGGFSVRNASIGAYGSPAIEIVITVFTLLFSINFAMYFLILCGKFKQVLKSDELRFFLCMVAFSTAAIAINLRDVYSTAGKAIRHAAFQVVTIVSTTGFSSTDYDLWPEFSRMFLVVLMLVGACAGSTAGGIKCARVLVLLKTVGREIRSIIHPRAVSVVKLDGETLSERTLSTIQSFFVTYMFFLFGAALIVGLDNFSFGTTLTAVFACVGNIGPGLEDVGPMCNYSAFSDLSKIVLSFCMIVGRLEVFPLLVLFSRNAWKKS